MAISAPTPIGRVVIRFAGDSGDGMQLTGDRFTVDSATLGNDIATLPNFPAEIRAPAGTVPGVSSFQLHFADSVITTPGDECDVLVAMNAAALKANVAELKKGGTIIVDNNGFTKRALAKVGWDDNPLENGELDSYTVHSLDLTGMTMATLEDFDLGRKEAQRSKNMFALGLLCWMYSRPLQPTKDFLDSKFAKIPLVAEVNKVALQAGYNFGETTESFANTYEVGPAPLKKGLYRHINGNTATAQGLMVGAHLAGLPLVFGAYPITPASDVLHELSKLKKANVTTIQAEDEIAAICAAIGASFGGALGVTSSSGPGLALKSEAMSLALMLEIPLVIVDVQRAGPSTGMPTKTEQSDLLFAMYGRHGDAPLPVIAAHSPTNCFDSAVEAVRIAVEHRTPVILLTDGYLANGAEPWRIPTIADLPRIKTDFLPADTKNGVDAEGNPVFHPYARGEQLQRPWVRPGTKGLAHRVGGLEKDITGNISYDPANHHYMVSVREEKIQQIRVPDIVVNDPDATSNDTKDLAASPAKVLVLGWGSTWGPITAAVERVRAAGGHVAQAHIQMIHPFPKNLGDVLASYDRVIVPEMNMGQLATLLRSTYLVDIDSFARIRGLPISVNEFSEYLAEAARIDPSTVEQKPGTARNLLAERTEK